MSLLKHDLPYHHDSAQLFKHISQQPWAMMLDSGQANNPSTGKAGSQYGRYDIIVAEPFITLVTQGEFTTISQNNQHQISLDDPFLLLKKILSQYSTAKTELPFAGGAMGYFAYDLGRRLEKIANTALPAVEMPEMMIGVYDWAVVVDHREKTCALVSYGLHAHTHKNWPALCAQFEQASVNAACRATLEEANSSDEQPFTVSSSISSNLPAPQYKQAFNASVTGNSWHAYLKLREISPAPFMAFMQLPLTTHENFQVLSNSPERFLQTTGHHVETRPIKGTRPRSSNAAQDLDYSKELLTSVKDKAENVMIVDLLRNDLGKNCEIGSVKVNSLFQLQSFANVHHMVSIVVGQLKPNAHALDVLKGCFPGGSITGAPKLSAMQIIEALEPHRRGLYCGAIGYIGFDGNMDTNIAIRTAVISKNALSFYAGGGIIADSIEEKEYAETLDKASSMIALLKFFMRL